MSQYIKTVTTGAKALATDGMRAYRHFEGHASANALSYGIEEEEVMMPDPATTKAALLPQYDIKIFTKRRFGLLRSLFIGWEPDLKDKNNNKGVGLMIVGDSFVDARCYAPLARSMAEEGYHVALITPPVRLHVVDADLCEEVLCYDEWQTSVESWVVVGHGMGGVVASSFCSRTNATKVQGLVLLGSYPYEGVDLSKLTNLKSIAYVYGTEDGIAAPEDVEMMEALLPESTSKAFVKLDGGNHTQFSSVDGEETLQHNDKKATMSREDQQKMTRKTILDVLIQVGVSSNTTTTTTDG